MIVIIPSNRNISLEYISPLIDSGARIIVVDDSEGSITMQHPQVSVYTWKDQERLLGPLSIAIPRKNGACRDFGFYIAWKESDPGEIIVALDDDCEVYLPDFTARVEAVLSDAPRPIATGQGRHFNVLDCYCNTEPHVFPRGFPYSARPTYIPWTFEGQSSDTVTFSLGLWQEIFDVNAIDKLRGPKYRYPDAELHHESVIVPNGALISVCSMNMIFRREVIPAVYQMLMHIPVMPGWVIDRYGDIWGGFILKTLMDIKGEAMAAGGPMIRHLKEGSYERNIWQEHTCHLVNDEFLGILERARETIDSADYVTMMAQFTDCLASEYEQASVVLKRYIRSSDSCAQSLDIGSFIATMRFLTLRNNPERYGSEGHMLRVAAGCAEAGWEVHAAFPQTDGMQSLIEDCAVRGIHYRPFVVPRPTVPAWKGQTTATAIVRTLRLLRAVNPDLVQVTLGWPTEAPGFTIACALRNVPTLAVFQLAPEKIPFTAVERALCAWARRRRQQWVAVSQHNLTCLCDSFAMPPEQAILLHNGADIRTPFTDCCPEEVQRYRQETRAEFAIPDNARILLTTGRLTRQKGYFDLVTIVRSLIQEFPDIYFLWAGTGEDQATIIESLRQQAVEKRVLLPGYRRDVSRLIVASDLFVFPTHAEGGCSSSIREAMAHGLPIVTTTAGGIPEVLTDGKHGLLVPPGKPEEMRAAVRFALNHPERMQAMAHVARQRIRLFSGARMIQDYQKAFAVLSSSA